ncbi:MAG: RNA methyltransferase, partial [Arcanobacterium sp.]|nr:RNA methyltransferase [Arcanobacterium sp.]
VPKKQIESFTGQLKKVTGLHRSANRQKYFQQLVEGPQAVRELLRFHPELVRDVYATSEALKTHPDLLQLIDELDPYTHLLEPELFLRISKDAQGILAVADIPDEPDLAEVFANSQLLVMTLRANDPGNLGTIIRCSDAFGAQAVITGAGSVAATNPKVIRSSVGSLFHIPVIEDEQPEPLIMTAKEAGFQVLAADAHGDFNLDELAGKIDLREKTLWVFGNEAHGFSKGELALADAVVSIPMWGNAESLNLAMAATLCIFESARAQN